MSACVQTGHTMRGKRSTLRTAVGNALRQAGSGETPAASVRHGRMESDICSVRREDSDALRSGPSGGRCDAGGECRAGVTRAGVTRAGVTRAGNVGRACAGRACAGTKSYAGPGDNRPKGGRAEGAGGAVPGWKIGPKGMPRSMEITPCGRYADSGSRWESCHTAP